MVEGTGRAQAHRDPARNETSESARAADTHDFPNAAKVTTENRPDRLSGDYDGSYNHGVMPRGCVYFVILVVLLARPAIAAELVGKVVGIADARYELLRRQYEERLKIIGLLTENEELQRMDAELVGLVSRLPEEYHYSREARPLSDNH